MSDVRMERRENTLANIEHTCLVVSALQNAQQRIHLCKSQRIDLLISSETYLIVCNNEMFVKDRVKCGKVCVCVMMIDLHVITT